jgi:hypothetical protein
MIDPVDEINPDRIRAAALLPWPPDADRPRTPAPPPRPARSIANSSSGATRASLMLEFAMASNAPKRSDSISSSRVGNGQSFARVGDLFA